MNQDAFTHNAAILDAELDWFFKVLDTRIKLQFGHECEYVDVFEVEPPVLECDHEPHPLLLVAQEEILDMRPIEHAAVLFCFFDGVHGRMLDCGGVDLQSPQSGEQVIGRSRVHPGGIAE